jgi:hypothetical protein
MLYSNSAGIPSGRARPLQSLRRRHAEGSWLVEQTFSWENHPRSVLVLRARKSKNGSVLIDPACGFVLRNIFSGVQFTEMLAVKENNAEYTN